MNRKDKGRVFELMDQLSAIKGELESLGEAEREKFDNMPEGLQSADTGQNIEQAADALESAADQLGDAFEELGGLL